jgi:signal transduction histidine kinase
MAEDSSKKTSARAAFLFEEQRREIFERTSRLFAALMALQWLGGIAAALWIAPQRWAGSYSDVHPHVWAAVFLGGAISFLPVALALTQPSRMSTRHVIAIGQTLTSALLIHLSGGRIETHFHVFGSLAFLAFYRDWPVLITASAVVAGDHLLRGIYWPQSVYGVLAIEPWRWLEHAGWVVFEDVFLMISIFQSVHEMRLIAERQANLEAVNGAILDRTVELRRETEFVRLLQQIAVASNEASDLERAMRITLDQVCASIGWPIGHVYMAALNGTAELVPWGVWHIQNGARFEALRRTIAGTRVPRGVGLAGRVLATGKPAWVRDVTHDGNLPGASGADVGVRSAIAFPVLVEKEVVAVLEFFSPDVVDTDGKLLEVMEHIGAQIGRVVERQRASDEQAAFTAKVERSNRELQDFAYVASHDLQEPLRKIQAFGDRLKASCGDLLGDQGRDYLERMQNAAKRMSVLISDLLAFSRVTTKAQPFIPVDLPRVTEEVLGDLEVRIAQSGGRVEVGELPTIDADPLQMRQLLQNLLGNALKFHRPGDRPVVKVSAELLAAQPSGAGVPAGELCQIRVEDNGIGFDEKYLGRIFNVFQRLHGRDEYQGTGIGLAICRKIAERHGGSITATSAPGKGAAFVVTLPVNQTEGAS